MKKRIKYKDGSIFFGSINENNESHGKGRINLKNGESYVGEWKNGEKDGFGIYYDKNSKVLKRGFWEKGIFLEKSQYFAKKNKQQLRSKYKQLHDEYIQQTNQALDGYGEDPDKHPFVDAPKELMDDKEFLLSLLEIDEYSQDLDFLEFTSERLLADKEFVTKVFSCEYYGDEYKNNISQKLRTDLDIINLVGFKIFKEFGYEILNSKTKLLKIIRNSKSKQFYDWKAIPDKIRSDKDFFLSLSTIPKCSHTLKWASKNIQKDPKIILSYLKTASEAIKYISEKVKNYNKLVENALSRKGSLILELNTKFKKNKHFVRIAAKTFPEIFSKIDKKLRNDDKIISHCINSNPELIKYGNQKLKSNKKIIFSLLRKNLSILKYCDKKFFSDKKLFQTIINDNWNKKHLFEGSSYSEKPLIYKFNKKLTYDPKLISLLIDKNTEPQYSGDNLTGFISSYFNYSKDRKLLNLAVKKSEYYYTGLNKFFRNNKEIALLMLEHGNNYLFKYMSQKLQSDKDILEFSYNKYMQGYTHFKTKKKMSHDINDIDSNDSLDWDLYWYIFYKINKDKFNDEVYNVENQLIKNPKCGFFQDYYKYKYTGEMKNGRPNGNGFASDEEDASDSEYITITTYDGNWLDGMPHGYGDLKVYAENDYPPNGQTDQHYRGEFKFGLKDGEGEIFDGTGKSLGKGNYKNDKKIS